MTTEEALQQNNQQERKILTKFILFSLLSIAAAFLVLYFTNIPQKSIFYFIAPLVLIGITAKYCGATVFFTKRKVEGDIIKINIYPIRTGKVKGVHSYESKRGNGLEAEIIIKTDKEDTILRVFPNSDITARLCIGDRVAFYRCIDEPIVVKGQYLR